MEDQRAAGLLVLLLDRAHQVVAASPDADPAFAIPPAGTPLARALPRSFPTRELVRRLERAVATGQQELTPALWRDPATNTRWRCRVVPLPHEDAVAALHVEPLPVGDRTPAAGDFPHLGAMSAAVAHELRNPLAGISGALQVIARKLRDDDPNRAILEKVDHQVMRLDHLVGDLQAFARRDTPTYDQVDLLGLTREVVGEGQAWADPELVAELLEHLLDNGAQAARAGGLVRVEVGPGVLLVADDGPGIPAEDRDRIFDPFFTTRTRGTGLGLAIARKTAVAMGGALALVEGPLAGAAFRLVLQEASSS